MRAGHPLGGEGLDILDGVLGGIGEKLAKDANSFIVGDMDVGLVVERFPVNILGLLSVGVRYQGRGPSGMSGHLHARQRSRERPG